MSTYIRQGWQCIKKATLIDFLFLDYSWQGLPLFTSVQILCKQSYWMYQSLKFDFDTAESFFTWKALISSLGDSLWVGQPEQKTVQWVQEKY